MNKKVDRVVNQNQSYLENVHAAPIDQNRLKFYNFRLEESNFGPSRMQVMKSLAE